MVRILESYFYPFWGSRGASPAADSRTPTPKPEDISAEHKEALDSRRSESVYEKAETIQWRTEKGIDDEGLPSSRHPQDTDALHQGRIWIEENLRQTSRILNRCSIQLEEMQSSAFHIRKDLESINARLVALKSRGQRHPRPLDDVTEVDEIPPLELPALRPESPETLQPKVFELSIHRVPSLEIDEPETRHVAVVELPPVSASTDARQDLSTEHVEAVEVPQAPLPSQRIEIPKSERQQPMESRPEAGNFRPESPEEAESPEPQTPPLDDESLDTLRPMVFHFSRPRLQPVRQPRTNFGAEIQARPYRAPVTSKATSGRANIDGKVQDKIPVFAAPRFDSAQRKNPRQSVAQFKRVQERLQFWSTIDS